jgi:hypothetical protein
VTEFVGKPEGVAPIEIVYAALDAAEGEIQEIGRGRRAFPFNRVILHVVAGEGDRGVRARAGAVIAGPPSLAERLVDRLRGAACTVDEIAVDVRFVPQRADDWAHQQFHVEFDCVDVPAPAATPEPADVASAPTAVDARIKLAIVKGTAAQKLYAFSAARIDIGRRAEVLDARQRLIRTNDIAFAEDGSEANASVSRKHAHLEFVPGDGTYRVWDDGSAQGTSIIRSGRTIRVPAGVRGARLEHGDELVLGQARLRVTIDVTPRPLPARRAPAPRGPDLQSP